MNCSITLKFNKLDTDGNPYQIVLDGVPSDSIQSYMSDYSKLLALVKAQGKADEFIEYSIMTGSKGSIYTSKEMEGLKDATSFFAPNISYDKLRAKYAWLPELSADEKANMNILFVKNLTIHGVPTPYIFRSRDVNGNLIYVVQSRGISDFAKFLRKQKAVTDYESPDGNHPKELQELINNVIQWQAKGDLFMRRFASYDTDTHIVNKTRTITVKNDPLSVAKELMLSYLRDSEKMYYYNMSGKNAGENLMKANLHRITLIKNAINAIRGYHSRPTITNSTLANAIFSKLIYGDDRGAKISISDFRNLVKAIIPIDEYKKYFPNTLTIKETKDTVNTILNQYFYKNDDTSTNYDTKSYKVNAIANSYIYFQRSFDSIGENQDITIANIPHMAEELPQEYRGYKIYKYTDQNGQTRFTFTKGLLTPQTYDYRIAPGVGEQTSKVKEKIDSMLGPSSRVHSRLYTQLYSDAENQGTSIQFRTYMGSLLPGQILRVYDQRLPLSIMNQVDNKMERGEALQKIEATLKEAELLDWFIQKSESIDFESSKLLDNNEKVFLTLATLKSLEGVSIDAVKVKLESLFSSYDATPRYYMVTNVDPKSGMATVFQMDNVNTSLTGESSYLSMHNQLQMFAKKIEDVFGVDTRVMTTSVLKGWLASNSFDEKTADIYSQQRALVLTKSDGEPIIIMNSDRATKSDLAHEYMHLFMGIVRSNKTLQEKYTQLLANVVSTKEGQEQLAEYSSIPAYHNLSQIDLMEEVVANVMGKYLTSSDPNTQFENIDAFVTFRQFLEDNTFHQNLADNIIDFSDQMVSFDKNTTEVVKKRMGKLEATNKERQITNFIQDAITQDQIKEDCK